MVRGWRPLLRKNLAETDIFPSKTPIFNQYSLVAPGLTPSEKSSINVNKKSTTRFPTSVLYKTNSVGPKGGSKGQNVQNLNNNLR